MSKSGILQILCLLCLAVNLRYCFVRVKRVIGGEPDESSDFGFLAALIGTRGYYWDILNMWGEYQKIYCSGALINDQWIITAAHCFSVLKDVEEENPKQQDKQKIYEEDEDYDEEDEKIKGMQNENTQGKKRPNPVLREIVDFSQPNFWKVRLAVQNLKKLSPYIVAPLLSELFDDNLLSINENANESSIKGRKEVRVCRKESANRENRLEKDNIWRFSSTIWFFQPTLKEKFFNFLNKFLNKSSTDTYYEISKIVKHPKYNPWFLEYDIALIKLTTKLNITENNHPRILPMTNNNDSTSFWPVTGQLCKVIGWGCKEFEGPIMDKPHSVNLPVLNPEYCRKIYRTDINLTDYQEFCAGYYGQDKGICSGDSGGPLLCPENDRTVLAGLVSATHIENPSKFPGIFSRISYFRQWINDVIKHQ